VPIFRRNGGRTVEYGRMRLNDYRMVLPIGLTLENLSPFAAMCAALPSIKPILGRHAFMAMSADDLLLLRHVLPTREEFLDYMRFRQEAAADKSAPRGHEGDHLADYAAANEAAAQMEDDAAAEERAAGEDAPAPSVDADAPQAADAVASVEEIEAPEIVEEAEPPRPREVTNLIVALQSSGEAGWQRAAEAIRARTMSEGDNLARALHGAAQSLATQEFRALYDAGEPPLYIWLQRFGTRADIAAVKQKAKAAAVAAGARSIVSLLVHATAPGEYSRAVSVGVVIPPPDSMEYGKLRAQAAEARAREALAQLRQPQPVNAAPPKRKMGRNEPCWCGSGNKFKRCHGKN
jgi:hypothetical protein